MPLVTEQPPAVVQQLSPEELAQQTLPRVGDLLAKVATQDFSTMSLSSLGLEGKPPLAQDRVVYAREELLKMSSPSSAFATKQMDTNGDSVVTVGEVLKFAYVADQVGNKDGQISVEEYHQLFSRGIQESLLNTAAKVGVSKADQKVLEGRFATGQFGLTGRTGLPDAIDLAQMSRNGVTTAEKTVVFAELLETATKTLPEGSRAQFVKGVFEHLASTGVTLIPVTKLEGGKLQLAGDSVEVAAGPKGSTTYRARSEILEFSTATGKISSVEVMQAESGFTLIGDNKYNHSSKGSNPFLESEIQRTVASLTNDADIRNAITNLKKATELKPPTPTELKKLLLPLSTKLQQELGVPSPIPFEVKVRSTESPQTLASYAHPVPGSGQSPKIELFVAPFLTQAVKEEERLINSGVEKSTAKQQALEGFRRAVVASLAEETFHGKQHSMIDSYNQDPKTISAEASSRIADYALNREFLVSPIDLKAYFGDTSAYENQPIESDAKKFRVAIVDVLFNAK